MENSYRRFVSINFIGLVLSGLLFTWLSRNGTFDFWLTQHFFDPVTQTFPLQHNRTLFFLGHTLLKKVTVVGWLLCLVMAIAAGWVPRLLPWRRALLTFFVMAACVAQLVQSLKGASIHACPYDLAMYGGHDRWFALFDPATVASRLGHCWPGGHASAGFAVIAGYFALRMQAPRWAHRLLAAGVLLGSVMAAVQIVRGAHFLSHNLWSLWLTWAVCLAIDMLIRLAGFIKHRKKVESVRAGFVLSQPLPLLVADDGDPATMPAAAE